MSWTAALLDLDVPIPLANGDGYVTRHAYIQADYTHNTNSMINVVVEKLLPGIERHEAFWGDEVCWWYTLDGMTGAEGARFLDVIVNGLLEMPERFRAMNPENGWGDYDGLVQVLTEMRAAAREYPGARWEASG